jgi:uncharacterized protein (DUF885 family)
LCNEAVSSANWGQYLTTMAYRAWEDAFVSDLAVPPDDGTRARRAVRDVADAYVVSLAKLNPLLATRLGLGWGQDQLPDLSPAGQHARDELARSTLAELDGVLGAGPPDDGDERRCARLLRERLEAGLALSASKEHLRDLRNIFGPINQVRNVFLLMPSATAEDWAVIARRMARVPEALAGQRRSLSEGARQGLLAPPRQVATVITQLGEWMAASGGRGWFAGLSDDADVPPAVRTDLDTAAAQAVSAVSDMRDWLTADYLPQADETPDAMGDERYRIGARLWTGGDIDPHEAYAWGWTEYQRLRAEMADQARAVKPGADAVEAMRYLDAYGEAVEGVEEIKGWLQHLMDDTIARLDPSHFQLAEPVKRVEARIAPAGSAAAPYYTAPTQDFSRPGRTWLPTLGEARFPLWNLISTWYHEGVPGHHLQLAHWTYLSSQLSVFQTSVGSVSACSEGWALYAERLMDELGFYDSNPGARLGYLDAQMMRAIRVVIDIGMHLRLRIPGDSPLDPGETWTPNRGQAFFAAHSGRPDAFVGSEIVRYLGSPGQAISYKLGERAWLAGRQAARRVHGDGFDLSAWHMAALSLGALGIDDLADELGRL